MLKMGSLFSGIGGLELGLERAFKGQLQTAWQVEKEPFCRSVLERHWSNAKRYNNVLDVGAHNLEPVDVICAGFPCQSISIAGKQQGLSDEEKSGLWWQVHRILSEFQSNGHEVPILVLENVPNIIRVGGPDVVGSLAQIGYDCEWTIISAKQCGAPHLRRRWFCVAYPISSTNTQVSATKSTSRTPSDRYTRTGLDCSDIRATSEARSTANTNSQRIQKQPIWSQSVGQERQSECGSSQDERTQQNYWQGFPTQSPVRGRNDGIPNRVDRLKSLGNAVVPQCAEWVGQQIIKSNILGERYVRN